MKRLSLWLSALSLVGLLSVHGAAQEPIKEKKTVVTYTGTVTKFERTDPALVYFKTDTGEVVAQLAPVTFLEENKLVFAPEDTVTVRGYETMVDGTKQFVVTEVTTKDKRVVKFRNDDFNPIWVKTTTANGVTTEKIMTVTGTVKSFERSDPAIVVVTADNRDIYAELAPMTFIEESKLAFAPKDTVKITGFETVRDGRPVFVVTEVTTNDNKVVKLRTDPRTPVWKKVTTVERGDVIDITGPVTVVDTVDTPDGRLVTIKTDAGERVVALGPGTYLEKNRYVLRQGDTIHVRGWEVQRPNRPHGIFLAGEIKVGPNNWRFRRPDRTVLWE
jgi:hypothetical protein